MLALIAGQVVCDGMPIAVNESLRSINFDPIEPLLLSPPDVLRLGNNVAGFDVEKFRGRVIFFDDLQALFDSHYWTVLPPEMRLFVVTHRHFQAHVFYSIPRWGRADKEIRDNTDRLIFVRRRGRTLRCREVLVRTDPKDPTGERKLLLPQGFLPVKFKLPFTPRDERIPIKWAFIKKNLMPHAGEMYDSWAPVPISDHVKTQHGRPRFLGTRP